MQLLWPSSGSGVWLSAQLPAICYREGVCAHCLPNLWAGSAPRASWSHLCFAVLPALPGVTKLPGVGCMVQFYVVEHVLVICPRGRCVQNSTVLVWKGIGTFYPSLSSPPTSSTWPIHAVVPAICLANGWARRSRNLCKTIGSWNHWKRPLGSLSPTINLTLPSPSRGQIPKMDRENLYVLPQ